MIIFLLECNHPEMLYIIQSEIPAQLSFGKTGKIPSHTALVISVTQSVIPKTQLVLPPGAQIFSSTWERG